MARREHFPLFEALRGIAALAVVTYHAVYLPALYQGIGGGWWWRYVMHLDVAVPIFLGISGFLLYRPFVAARLRDEPMPRIAAYGWRRFLRIVPGYWFALTVLTLWFWWQPPGFEEVRSLGGVLRFYGFAQLYSSDTAIAGIGQAWTLGVEVVFYALLPLWALLMRRLRPSLRSELVGLACVIAGSLAWKAAILTQVDYEPRSLNVILPVPTWLDLLGLGMLLAVLSVHVQQARPDWGWLRRVEARPAIAWAAALAFWLGACWLGGPSGEADDPVTDRIYLVRHVFYGLFVVCLLAPAVFGDPAAGGVRRVLRWRPFAYVGTISFSFYLFHYAVLDQMAHSFGGGPGSYAGLALWWLLAIAGSLVLGTIGYRLVELPFMRLGRLVRSGPREPAPDPSAAAQAKAAP